MSLFSFFQKKTPSVLIEKKLLKARDDAYRYATAELAHKNVITREQIDTELKNVAKELDKLDY